MIDFTDLDERDSDVIGRVAHTDSMGVQRGACNVCDCREWVGWTNGANLSAARPYCIKRHEELLPDGAFNPCRRCGCHAAWHEDISDLVADLSNAGLLVDAEEGWTDLERWLCYRTGGGFFPRGNSDRLDCEGEPVVDGQAQPLVSVICPTDAERREFVPFMYECFREQTYENKELIVVDTGDGTVASDFFTHGPPSSDPRVVYRYFDTYALPWSIGVKRNVACHLARGAIIVHFDDDDLYAPAYLACMVQALQDGKSSAPCLSARLIHDEGDGVASPERKQPVDGPQNAQHEAGEGLEACLGHPGYIAGAATLSSWHTYSALTGTFGLCDVDGMCNGRRDWAFGYGFSFAYLRSLWSAQWFRDANMGEDYKLFESLLARGVCVALLRDEGAGICAHVRHKTNFSPWEDSSEVDAATVGQALPLLGERLRAVILANDRAVQNLGANGEVRLTPKSVEDIQTALLAGFAREEFQKRLHETFAAAGDDPTRQKTACRQLCLEVQGPVLARYGFEPTYIGVLASTAAAKVVLGEEWDRPESVSTQRGQLINWLMRPDLQYYFPQDPDWLRRAIDGHLRKRAAMRRKKD